MAQESTADIISSMPMSSIPSDALPCALRMRDDIASMIKECARLDAFLLSLHLCFADKLRDRGVDQDLHRLTTNAVAKLPRSARKESDKLLSQLHTLLTAVKKTASPTMRF